MMNSSVAALPDIKSMQNPLKPLVFLITIILISMFEVECASSDRLTASIELGWLLLSAADDGDVGEVRRLLERNAYVDSIYMDGLTSLMIAAQDGNVDVLNALLANHAAIDLVDGRGYTALLHAVENDQKDTFKILIDHGAEYPVNDHKKNTAWIVAVQGGHNEIVKLLLEIKYLNQHSRIKSS